MNSKNTLRTRTLWTAAVMTFFRRRRDVYYFVRITPANVLYALWLSLRAPVTAWKITVPHVLAQRFHRVRPYRLWSRDEWLLAHDAAFDLWKQRAFPILSERHPLAVTLGKQRIDFSRNLWQLLGIEFEALSLFVAMAHEMHPASDGSPRIVEPWLARAFDRNELASMFPQVRIIASRANRWLESAYEWAISTAHLGRTLVHAAASFLRARRRVGPRAVAWLGISAAEIPSGDQQLNFAWAAQYGYLAPQQVLYFLPTSLTSEQRIFLQAQNVETLEPAETFTVLSPYQRMAVAARSIAGFLSALLRPSTSAPFLARFMARAPYWDALYTALDTRVYVTSGSYSWPEKAELAVTAARSIRSIMWAYSANTLTFSISDPAFRDLGAVRSIVIAQEFWVWNRAFAEWLEKRQVITTKDVCQIRIVGPLMCGNPHLLALDSRAARERLGVPADGICIGVFDMPMANDLWRDRFGGGPPMVDKETYIAFWNMVKRIVTTVPGCFTLIKLKREFGHTYREFPDVLRELVDRQGDYVKSGKLLMVDANVDPYLPIAACDIALGIAYTSPILAARCVGKPAFYVDPLRRANFPSNRDYTAITVTSEQEVLVRVLAAASNAKAEIHRDATTPPPALFPLHVNADGSIEREYTLKDDPHEYRSDDSTAMSPLLPTPHLDRSSKGMR